MIRKIRTFLLICLTAVLGLSLAGCGPLSLDQADEETGRTHLYYLNSSRDGIVAVDYVLQEPDVDGQIMEFIALLSRKPSDEELVSLLPDGVVIQDYKLDDTCLTLNLSKEAADMEPARKILMAGGLVRTFTQIDGVDSVILTADGDPLKNSYGDNLGELTNSSFTENAGRSINSYQYASMTLYFTDETGTQLLPETRKVYYSSSEPIERAVIEQLIQGPTEAGHYAVLPSDTRILGVSTQNSICYVNFDDSVQNALLSVREEIPLYAVVDSLADTCGVGQVQFTINGESDVTFRSSMKLSKPYSKNTDLIRAGSEIAASSAAASSRQ